MPLTVRAFQLSWQTEATSTCSLHESTENKLKNIIEHITAQFDSEKDAESDEEKY